MVVEILSTIATARCVNCDGKIVLFDRDRRWFHHPALDVPCPDAPLAAPRPGTLAPAQPHDPQPNSPGAVPGDPAVTRRAGNDSEE